MFNTIEINGRSIGWGLPVYVIAEMSGNHNQSFEKAMELVKTEEVYGASGMQPVLRHARRSSNISKCFIIASVGTRHSALGYLSPVQFVRKRAA
jgi:hypothetical protein